MKTSKVENISPRNTISRSQHCDNGLTMDEFKSFECRGVNENIVKLALNGLLELSLVNRKRKKLSTVESVQSNKKRILNDKSTNSRPIIQVTNSSEKSDQVLTSNVKESRGFWNSLSTEWSKKLWSCTRTDLQESGLNSLNSSFKNLMSNSWFTVKVHQVKNPANLQKTCLHLQLSLSQVTTGKEQQLIGNEEEPKKKLKTVKIKIKPTTEQKELLKKWFGSVRFIYNKCVEQNNKLGSTTNKTNLRMVSNNSKLYDWMNEIPYEVRDSGITDVYEARKAHLAKLKKNPNNNKLKNATFQFRSKKNIKQETIRIRARDYNRKRGVFANLFRNLKSNLPLPETTDNEVKVIRDYIGNYYLAFCIPNLERKHSNSPNRSVAALDPGDRTFQTVYDVSGKSIELGKDDKGRIYRLCSYIDELKSKISKSKSKRKRKMTKALRRMFNKVRNLVKEVHNKASNWLCRNYETILLPKFESQQMTTTKSQGKRVINSKVARSMLTWSHYTFQQMLLFRAKQYGSNVIICDENYTTKTCGCCGILNNIGSSKDYKCRVCDYQADRDINASRNILIRYLTLQGISV